jgi:hypothetical protein
MTLVDLARDRDVPPAREEWAIEPTTEFIHHLRRDGTRDRHRNAEEETTLMCPGGAVGARTGNSRSTA